MEINILNLIIFNLILFGLGLLAILIGVNALKKTTNEAYKKRYEAFKNLIKR